MSNQEATVTIRVSDGAIPDQALITLISHSDPGFTLDATSSTDSLSDLNLQGASADDLVQLGESLCAILLPSGLRDVLVSEIQRNLAAGSRTRISLEIEQRDLQTIPWELLYLGGSRPELGIPGFVCLHPMVGLVRSIGETARIEPRLDPPLRVLLVHADPNSRAFPSLPAARLELLSVQRALKLPEFRSTSVTVLTNATPSNLQRALFEEHPHVFHFIGHGGIHPTGSFIVLEGAQPRTESLVYAEQLAKWLTACPVGLSVLSACHSSMTSFHIAQALNQYGVAATIGMQFAWSDAAAGLFSRAFYGALADPMPVERALWQGRTAISGLGGDWAAPVLYARMPADAERIEPDDETRPEGVPCYLTPIIGREADSGRIRETLAVNRLVTLTGAGGVGKTRLGVHVANTAASDFEGGWKFVSLGTVSTADLVPNAVATALGVREEPSSSLTDLLVLYLRHRTCLLLLDNCEHVRTAVAQLVRVLLGECPGLKVMATSRESLGIPGEVDWLVNPLPFPTPLDVSNQGALQELSTEFPAYHLFIDRASAANRRFSVSESNAKEIATICSLLDGLPLAIELAAARVQSISVREIAQRLSNLFGLLTGGEGRLPHQQTIQATVDWSYGLLTEPEAALFAALSIFVGGWTLDAAEGICGNAGLGLSPGEVLAVLAQLVRKSLVCYEEYREDGRYRMLETVRVYARAKLDEEHRKRTIARKHARWFTELAQAAEPGIRGPGQMRWLDRLDADYDNILAAIAWAVRSPRTSEYGLTIAASLWHYWEMRGHFGQGRYWLETTLKAHPDNDILAAKAITGLSFLAAYQADSAAATDAGKRALKISADTESAWLIAQSLHVLGYSYWTSHPDQAKSILEKSVAAADESGNLWIRTVTRLTLAAHDLTYGRIERARSILIEGLAQARELSDNWLIAEVMSHLGWLAAIDNEPRQASAYLEESIKLYRPFQDSRTLAHLYSSLGAMYLQTDRLEEATDCLREGNRLAREVDDQRRLAAIYCGISVLAMRRASHDYSVRLLAAVSRMPQDSTALSACWRLTDHKESLRDLLGDKRFQIEWNAGLAMDMAQTAQTANAVLKS